MPLHIMRHSIVVEKIATFILKNLNFGLSFPLVSAGALLHDIAKHRCIGTEKDHAEEGARICIEHGLDKISQIVRYHIVLHRFSPDDDIDKVQIVYYADKRVNGEEVVSLNERLSYILDKYGKDDPAICDRIKRNFMLCRKVEEKIFNYLDLRPEDIKRFMRALNF